MSSGRTFRKIHSRAPTRIDLAGGTVDIWPIYLFLNQPTTINLGIDLYAEAELVENDTGHVLLRSGDQGTELKLEWHELDQAKVSPMLELHLKYLLFFLARKKNANLFDPAHGLTLTTSAKSPAGAGLGGSSTLSIAMIGALATWASRDIQESRSIDPMVVGERLIEVARDVETTVIQVPAGLQDYYGAMFGGVQSLRWLPAIHDRKWLANETMADDLMQGLEKRLILFYSGQSRNSGINNWALFKSFMDRQGSVREHFQAIADATCKLEKALKARDWVGIGEAIQEEWQVRRHLASGISTPEMDQAFALALNEGATAGKICGAGGGGCFFVYLPTDDAALRARIQDKIISSEFARTGGIRALPFQASRKGLDIRIA
ncbi:MAG: hypothetical protein H7222_04690 [Methylotenera sp.]|nr:hypothetical protein [Oligoflexia bacterium]